mgnify:CR=1 FL=1
MIAIGCDHGGYELKQKILAHLRQRGLEYRDFGCDSTASVDYPVYGKAVAHAVASGECEKGIVICSTGIGISIAANKVKGIRCALCTDSLQAEMTRRHNDANMMALGAGITGGNAKLWEIDPATWRQVMQVNLNAPYVICRALVPGMIARGYGRIVNIASIAGKEGNPNASHYSASKAGLIALTKSLGKELAGTGVVVNCITPAAARTPIFDQMKQEHID